MVEQNLITAQQYAIKHKMSTLVTLPFKMRQQLSQTKMKQ